MMRIVVALGGDLGIGAEIFLEARLVADDHVALHIVDVDVVLGGEVEQMLLGILGHVEQRLGEPQAERSFHLLGPPALAGAELAAIAAGRAVAEAVGIDQHDIDAGFAPDCRPPAAR